MEETRGERVREAMCDLLCDTLRTNNKFIWTHARAVYVEIGDLTLDAMGMMGDAPRTISKYPAMDMSSTRLFFAAHVLNPLGNGILSAVLDGNMPACFMMLRLLLETLLTCWCADQDYSGLNRFDERLSSFHKKPTVFSGLCKRLDSDLKTEGVILNLWKSLSNNWVHSSRQAARFMETIDKTGDPPSSSVMIPVRYGTEDVEFLELLGTQVQQFRKILKIASEKWPAVS
jgi:hypothetical protein